MQVNLKDLSVPNFVLLDLPDRDGCHGRDVMSMPIGTVPAEDLAKLCDTFRSQVFAKAKKQDPQVGKGNVKATHFYCSACDDIRPVIYESELSEDVSDTYLGGDILCANCKLVIATFYTPARGEYESPISNGVRRANHGVGG